MRLATMRLTDLYPADYNPRKALKPGDAEFEKLRQSIETFGLVEPLIWNENTGNLVGGHQRLSVLQYLGMDSVDVSIVNLDVDHEKALNVALNKIEGAWDNDKLQVLLSSLYSDLQDLTGFGEAEIEALCGEKKSTSKSESAGSTELPPITQCGDLWLIGRHRLVCGDSCNPADMNLLMDGQQAKLVITDPPYNVNYGDKAEMLEEYLGTGNRNTSHIMNDNMDDASFRQFLLDAYRQMYGAMAPGAAIYVFHADTEGINFRTTFKEAGFKLSQCLIWVKSSIVLGRNDYHWRHEPILYGWKETGPHRWYGGRKRSTTLADGACVTVQKREDGDVLSFSDGFNHFVVLAKDYQVLDDGHDDTMTVIYHEKPSANDMHPTMKPVDLVARLMRNSSKKGDLVLDPFGGSGSTLMACEENNRKCVTMEMDPHYCDVIVKRYVETTNRQDVFLIRNGKKIPYVDTLSQTL